MGRVCAEELNNNLLSSDLTERIKQPADCPRKWYQQLSLRRRSSPRFSPEKGDKSISEPGNEIVEIGVEQLGIVLVRFQLYHVNLLLAHGVEIATLPIPRVYQCP